MVLSQQVAKKRFPGLVVASMGAVKKEKDGVISARVVCDGTNGSYVNNSTHLRDQERSPVAGDIKRFMREKARVGEPTFGLTADIKEAHRQIPIHPSDWHLLGSQLEPDGEVFINTVGTFGISSASCWWSRVSTAMGRLYQYIVGRYASPRGRLPHRDGRSSLPSGAPGLLPAMRRRVLPSVLVEDVRWSDHELGGV